MGVGSLLYPPDRSTTRFRKYVDWIREIGGIPFGVPEVDEVFNPLVPGDVCLLVGATGAGKTSLLLTHAYHVLRSLQENDRKECVLFVAIEQPIEQIELVLTAGDRVSAQQIVRGEFDIAVVEDLAVDRLYYPVFLMGYSLDEDVPQESEITPQMIGEGVTLLRESYGYEPAVVYVDYLQILGSAQRTRNRVNRVAAASADLKRIARNLGVRFVVAAQAGGGVEGVPGKTNVMWSYEATHPVDKFIGMYRPIQDEEYRAERIYRSDDVPYQVVDSLVEIILRKQRFGKDWGSWLLNVDLDAKRVEIAEPMETPF